MNSNPTFYPRYRNTPVSSVAPEHLQLWVPPKFRTRTELPLQTGQYTEYIVTDADIGRLDVLAARLYNDASLWWVIAYVNSISNPLEQMSVGLVLKLPTVAYVQQFLT